MDNIYRFPLLKSSSLFKVYGKASLVLVLLGLTTACQKSNNTPGQTASASLSEAKNATINLPIPAIISQSAVGMTSTSPTLKAQTAELSGKEVAERLEVSYARASAYKSNECPKLVEFQFSNQSITRQDEQFPKQNCDYIIYLRKGESLTIDVSQEVKAQLISPVNFDFANGSYTAPKYDKYTVRLSYDGTRFNPENFKYDVILTKGKSEETL